MAKHAVYIDGASGTTGLQIQDRLESREEIELIVLDGDRRKDLSRRLEALSRAEIGILCLPDAAAREIAAAAPPESRIIDASTAHRVQPGWVYGFPELRTAANQARRREALGGARRVAVPGCHATGFLALALPLIQTGLIAPSRRFHCHSLTGYSGGGNTMIAAYQDPRRPPDYSSPRQYGLNLEHKHLPEMQSIGGLERPPLFCPIVDDFYQGMLVSLSLGLEEFANPGPPPSIEALRAVFADYYRDEPLIHTAEGIPRDGTMASNTLAGRDDLEIWITGGGDQRLLMARFDNLGKGASGAAVQCLNLMLGLPEYQGLRFRKGPDAAA
ncbi:MAG: N-acetyl-gamma-glutamyl-phosphate reductase [Treponema sp.]|jgi:N-acetyl-gamma-glutamyl-phosphate reductase|nr:N-acetyl-gamma-glutamyl-phosphate reductase [Treponema sp.]